MFYISGFYKIKKIYAIKKAKKLLTIFFRKYKIRGTIIISSEGINGTISSNKKNLEIALKKIQRVVSCCNFTLPRLPCQAALQKIYAPL